jgi:FKBP-type peptidyl-prolyl cis-trans isomerase
MEVEEDSHESMLPENEAYQMGMKVSSFGLTNNRIFTIKESSRMEIMEKVISIAIAWLTISSQIEKWIKSSKRASEMFYDSEGPIINLPNGVKYQNIFTPDNSQPVLQLGDLVNFEYKCFYNGVEVSRYLNNIPRSIIWGDDKSLELMKPFDKAILAMTDMRRGGKRKFLIPIDEAIPPFISSNSALLIELKILELS